MNNSKVDQIEAIFKVYENELQTTMPFFTEELIRILNIEKKKTSLNNNFTPHYSSDFTQDFKRHKRVKTNLLKEKEMVTVDLTNLSIDSEEDAEEVNEKEVFCNSCMQKHSMEHRLCNNCLEEHEGCCEISD
mgnify:CR=1 FL=1